MPFSLTFSDAPSPALLERIAAQPGRFSHFYFKVGGLEPDREKFGRLAEVLRPLGADLVYSLAYPCCGGEEFTARFGKKLLSLLRTLRESGIPALQVENPYFIELLRSPFPPFKEFGDFKIYLGPGFRLNRRAKLRYLEVMDLTLASLSPFLNHRQGELLEILRPLVGRGEIIANSGCFPVCPLETDCAALQYHREEESLGEAALQAYRRDCGERLKKEPWRVFTLPLIPPEEIEKFPGDYFHLLTPTDDPARSLTIVEAYLRGRSPDDLGLLPVKPGGGGLGQVIPRESFLAGFRERFNCGGECEPCGLCRKLTEVKENADA